MYSPLSTPIARSYPLMLAIVGIALATAVPASAQQLSGWTGAIRCELQAQAPGHSHQETQTWTLTGAAPTVQGSVTAYPATWSVVGGGQHDVTRLTTRRIAQWTANVAGVAAPIGFTQHALGRTFDVSKWHAQLTGPGGYTGGDQFINGGVPSSSQPLVMTVYEWQFPKIEAATTDTQLAGSNTTQVRTQVGPLQPGEAVATVTCTWSLARGSASPLPPPAMQPPSAPPTQPGGSASGGTAPAGTAPGGAAAGGVPPAGTGTTAGGTPPGGTTPGGVTGGGPPAGGAVGGTPAVTADLQVVLSSIALGPAAAGGSVSAGGTVNYGVELWNVNPGAAAADGAILRVRPSAGQSDWFITCAAVSGAVCPAYLVSPSQLESGLAISRLPAGGLLTLRLSATVTGAVGSDITLHGDVTLPAGVSDPNLSNNAHTATSRVVAGAGDNTTSGGSTTGPTAGGSSPGVGTPAGGGAAGRPIAGGATIETGTPGSTVTNEPPAGITSDLWTVINGVEGHTKGKPFVFESRVRNLGPAPVTGAIFTVAIAPLSAVSITQMVCTPIPCPTIAQLANGFATPTLGTGADFRIYIHGTWNADAGSSVTFAVTGRAPAGLYDPDSNNNSESFTAVIAGP